MTVVPPWVARNVTAIDKAAPPAIPGSPMDYALRYAAIGWHVFPVWGAADGKCRCGEVCKSPGKHPVEHLARGGVTNATINPDQIRAWWNQFPEAGIGVSMAGSGMVAIDIDPRNGGLDTIDQIEAQHGALESDVLAFTQGGGEHRVFSLASDAGLPGKLGKGVDIKRNGYIVVEPTQGVQGQYAWEASSDPLEGAVPSPLPDWLRGLAQSREPVSSEPVRFATSEQIEELRGALSVLDSDDRDIWVRFLHALKPLGQDGFDLWDEWSRKSGKYDPVDAIAKWHSAKPTGAINYETIFFAAQAAGWVNPLAGGLPPIPLPKPSKAPLITIQPDSRADKPLRDPLVRVPGALGLFADYYASTAVVQQPEFAVQSALALGSVVCGRHYKTDRRTNFSNLWFLIVGKTGSGKEHPKSCIERVLIAADKAHMLADGYTSRAGVFSKLDVAPAHIAIIDEIGRHLEVAKDNSSSHLRDAVTCLMESFNRSGDAMRPPQYALRNVSAEIRDSMSAPVMNPCITLLGMTTPSTLYSTVDQDAVQDGFLGRFILVESDIDGADELTEEKASSPPDDLIDWVKAAISHDTSEGNLATFASPLMAPSTRTVHITEDAWRILKEHKRFEGQMRRSLDDQGVAELVNRSTQKAIRVALVLSVSVNPHAPVITPDLAQWASDYVRMTEGRMIESVTRHMVSGRLGKLAKQVADYVARGGIRGRTLREIKNCHLGGHGRDLDESLKLLVDSGKASFGDIAETRRGRKRTAYVHRQFMAAGDDDET